MWFLVKATSLCIHAGMINVDAVAVHRIPFSLVAAAAGSVHYPTQAIALSRVSLSQLQGGLFAFDNHYTCIVGQLRACRETRVHAAYWPT